MSMTNAFATATTARKQIILDELGVAQTQQML